MMMWGSWVAAALAKVGRRLAMVTRPGVSLLACETEDRWEEADDSLDTDSDIYLCVGQAVSLQK